MAKKIKYCEHSPYTKVYHRSKSVKTRCCDECYSKQIGLEIIASHGLKQLVKLDIIKHIDFDIMWKRLKEEA